MSLEDLILKLRIEEDNKNTNKKSVIFVAKANIVVYSQYNKNRKASKNKHHGSEL